MRRLILALSALAVISTAAPTVAAAEEAMPRAIPIQATAPAASPGWTFGKVVTVGVGAVAGVMVANAALPMAWGMATPIAGAVVGGMVGSWVHARATEPAPMLRTRASMSAEAPSLFQMATFVSEE